MSIFSREWLALREGTDQISRNAEVANAVAARFTLRDSVKVVDLGCGTGANLRAIAPLLPKTQSWTLADIDQTLLSAARIELRRWADSSAEAGDLLHLKKGAVELSVSLAVIDLSKDLDAVFAAEPDLITTSAFVELVSEDFIRMFARRCSERRIAFYSALAPNGRQRWTPHRPTDNRIAGALHRLQLADRGFGPAAGPAAPALLSDYFRVSGYSVIEGDSPWRLDSSDRMLIAELVRGYAFAAAETGEVDDQTIETWVKVNRTAAEIGHTDTFAAPA